MHTYHKLGVHKLVSQAIGAAFSSMKLIIIIIQPPTSRFFFFGHDEDIGNFPGHRSRRLSAVTMPNP